MAFGVRRFARNFIRPLHLDVDLIPRIYSWSVVGGPLDATIDVTGSEQAVWDVLNWLRCPIEIYNNHSDTVWWGFIEKAEVMSKEFTLTASLETMFNRVRAHYTIGGGGVVATDQRTPWVQDDRSVESFGYKELEIDAADVKFTEANKARDRFLQRHRYPTVSPTRSQSDQLVARLTCRGWLDSMSWRYYDNAQGVVEYNRQDPTKDLVEQSLHNTNLLTTTVALDPQQPDGSTQQVNNLNAALKIGQPFIITTSYPWLINTIWISLARQGEPVGTFQVTIQTNDATGGDHPSGAIIATSTIVSQVDNNLDGILDHSFVTASAVTPFTFSPIVPFVSGQKYWIVLEITGTAIDAVNYFKLGVEQINNYGPGTMRLLRPTESTWISRTPNSTLLFGILGVRETTEQMRDMVEFAGQNFLTGLELTNSSGIYTFQYRDGDRDGLTELLEALSRGATGDRAMNALVTQERRLRVFLEPLDAPESTIPWRMSSDGILRNKLLVPLEASYCPVGQWVLIRDVIPPSVDLSQLINPDRFFIMKSTYDIDTAKLSIEARGAVSPYNSGGSGLTQG